VKKKLFFFSVFLVLGAIQLSASADIYRITTSVQRKPGELLDTVHGEAHFPHPPAVVTKLLRNYAGYKAFFPLMRESTLITPPDQVKFKFDARFPIPDFWSLVKFKEENKEKSNIISWRLIKGNVKENSGTVVIQADPKSEKLTFLTIDFKFDPGGFIAQSNVTEKTVPYVKEALLSMGKHIARFHQSEVLREKSQKSKVKLTDENEPKK